MLCPISVLLLLCAQADPSAQPRALVLSEKDLHCGRRLSVEGFSDNERALAIRQHVTCRNKDATVDHFDIIDLIYLKDLKVLATYQATPVTRTGPHAKLVFAPPRTLRTDNPAWASAHPIILWSKLKRAGHFSAKKHDFKDVMVRIRRDPDSKLDVEAKGTTLKIFAPKGTPIGFGAVGRLVDGNEIELGHVREAEPCMTPLCGSLEVAFSRHGHEVALLHHGLTDDEIILTETPAAQPIASTQVGFLQMLHWDADSVKELYGELHPDGKRVWDEMVGGVE